MFIDAPIIQHIVQMAEEAEKLNAPIACYKCEVNPEIAGGLCADCLIRNKVTITD